MAGNANTHTLSASTPPFTTPSVQHRFNSPPAYSQDLGTWLATRLIAILVTGIAIYLISYWPNLLDRLTSTGRRTENVFQHLTRPKFEQTPEGVEQTKYLLSALSDSQKLGREISLRPLGISAGSSSRDRLLAALHGYTMYEKCSLDSLNQKRKSWAKISQEQKVLASRSGVNYPAKIAKVERLIRSNGDLCKKIICHGMRYYGISEEELNWYIKLKGQEGIARGLRMQCASDHKSVTHALKHFVRDWSDAGLGEREVTFRRILLSLELLVPDLEQRRRMKILIPGCGVGGLVWKVAEMGFGTVICNEWSYYMNLLQHFIGSGFAGEEEKEKEACHTLYPYIEWWSHQASNDNMTRGINFPYANSPLEKRKEVAQRISIIEGDFTQLSSLTSPDMSVSSNFDIIITLFFIDTARNIFDYLQKINSYLKVQGIWINLGPLLYDSAPLVEFSLSEVIALSEKGLGFDFQKLFDGDKWERVWRGNSREEVYDTMSNGKVVGLRASYAIDERGLGINEYLAQGWIARKTK